MSAWASGFRPTGGQRLGGEGEQGALRGARAGRAGKRVELLQGTRGSARSQAFLRRVRARAGTICFICQWPVKPPLQPPLRLWKGTSANLWEELAVAPGSRVRSRGSLCLGLCTRPVSVCWPIDLLSLISKRRCRTRPLGIFPMQSHLPLKLQDLLWLFYKTLSNPFKPYLESQPALQMASTLTSLRGQPTALPFNV